MTLFELIISHLSTIARMMFQTDPFCGLTQTPERDFTVRISGIEIYNENVRDLLNSESGRNLKLLDDPEVRPQMFTMFFYCFSLVFSGFTL